MASQTEIPYRHTEAVHNYSAATEVLPVLFELFQPNSILDVGCGLGTWLKIAKDLGVKTVQGIDGNYLNRELLKISTHEFLEYDLMSAFNLNRKFDLVICLEVAEHLPELSAKTFVESLTKHANVILFSAAIPGQGGQNHINEQWPLYWKELFEEYGFVFLDLIRPKIWLNKKIEFWYRQNIFLVVKKGHALAALGKEVDYVLPLIHPELWERTLQVRDQKIASLKEALRRSNRNLFRKIWDKLSS